MNNMMIPGYQRGSELLLLNTLYFKPQRQDNGKYSDDYITLVMKDTVEGKKFQHTIQKPTYQMYVAKEDVPIDHNMLFIDKDKVDMVEVPNNDLLKEIAEISGHKDLFYENLRNGNRAANNEFFMYPRVFNADTHIEDHYRFRFDKFYKQELDIPSLLFFDIEVDGIDIAGDFPEMGEAPINAVTLVNNTEGKVYTLLLREASRENDLIQALEDELNTKEGMDNFINSIKDKLEESAGSWKNVCRLGLDKLEYGVNFYDEEIELIQDIFNLINMFEPDFVLAWNMAFDIPYIIERIRELGYDPAEIMCHPDFPVKEAYYYVDERAQDFAERGDYARISSYSVYIDQLIHFASRRKGQARVASYKLDYIGELMAKMKKLDYSHITRNIAELPYKDYKIFVIYNIIDTLVQKAVESRPWVEDVNYLYNKAIQNNTRYHKAHRQTVYLTNRAIKEFDSEGMIMGNNINRFKPRPDKKFPGALVGDPTLMEQENLITVNGVPLRIAKNADDFDFSSLYPSLMKEFNIAPNTEIGKINIVGNPYEGANPFGNDRFDNSGLFIEDFISGNWIEVGSRWFGLPNILAMIKLIEEYFIKKNMHDRLNSFDAITGLTTPFVISPVGEQPFVILDKDHPEKPFFIERKMVNVNGFK